MPPILATVEYNNLPYTGGTGGMLPFTPRELVVYGLVLVVTGLACLVVRRA